MKTNSKRLGPCVPVSVAYLVLLAGCSGGGLSGNAAPRAEIDFPFDGTTFDQGAEIGLSGSAIDREDGQLPDASLAWSSGADGPLGNGHSLATSALSLGTHEIVLTATDSVGAQGTARVHIRVVEPTSTQPRAGETNPYAGRMQRTPEKLDDELILFARSNIQDQLLCGILEVPVTDYDGTSSDPVPPLISARLDHRVPVAASSGRILGSNMHQAAVVSSSGSGAFQLDVFGLADPGEDRYASHAFVPPFPLAPLDVHAADLDAFEEATGGRALEPPAGVNARYYDEVALAYPELVGSDLLAHVDVLSFEGVDFPPDAGAPPSNPTSVTTILSPFPMLPGSRIVLAHGDKFFGTSPSPHLLLAYLDPLKRVAIDVFEYVHTRPDPAQPDPETDVRSLQHVLHIVISTPLDDAAAAAGGWDVAVERGSRLGMDDPLAVFDVVLVVRNSGGDYLEQAWKMEGLDGLPGPVSVGQQSGEFARVIDPASGNPISLSMLPDTRVEVAVGRIVDRVQNRCEALGLFVLADTNRGAVVQSMTAFVQDPFIGEYRFGPVNPAPLWPRVITLVNHPETTATTRTTLVAGGFVSQRNGLIDERGDPSGTGTEYAQNCEHADPSPFLGPMPSFYVADPDASELHSVTTLLGSSTNGAIVTVPLDPAIDERVILLAADAVGDAAYYRALRCAGTAAGDCRRVFLGDAELHYVIEDVEIANVVLQQPPKHVDYLRELGGIVNVSMDDGFYAEFAQTDQASGSITRKRKTDWSIGTRAKLAIGPPTPPGEDFSSIFDMSLDAEHHTVQEQFQTNEVSVSLTQTTGAVDDDVVWSKRQTIDYWRFAASGGKPTHDANAPSGFPDDAYMEIAIPDEPVTMIGPGTLNEDYQPLHMVGNILSYPTFSGGVDDLGDLFDFLGRYVPSDANGTRTCRPLADGDINGCLVLVNDVLTRVSEVAYGDEFVGGEFETLTQPIDVAEVLQVGGISYSSELEFDSNVRNGLTVTNNDTIKAEANLKIPISAEFTSLPFDAELEGQLRAAASFELSKVSENTLGSKTKVALHLPASIPVERSYQIRPSFGFTPSGSLHVSYQVNTDGAASPFWELHYGAPDPALDMPHRIVRGADGLHLGTDFSRGRIKGFFVRDGTHVDPQDPVTTKGPLVTQVPRAGDRLQLEVRVFNLSVASAIDDLDVVFSVQRYEGGAPVGSETQIAATTIPFLPHRGQFSDQPDGHAASAYVLWDTSDFGPAPGDALVTYLVRVTLDPDDRIHGETHELYDRFNDPLRGSTGEALDPDLEKGQNNTGWSIVRIAAPLSEHASVARGSSPPRRVGKARARDREIRLELSAAPAPTRGPVVLGALDAPLALNVVLRADRTDLDHGSLQVFDGDPSLGGEPILSRTVQGIDERGSNERFEWRPRTRGSRMLHAVYTGSKALSRSVAKLPVLVE